MTDEEHLRTLSKAFLALDEAVSAARLAGLDVECSFAAGAEPRLMTRRTTELLNMTPTDAAVMEWVGEIAKENPGEAWLRTAGRFLGFQHVRNLQS